MSNERDELAAVIERAYDLNAGMVTFELLAHATLAAGYRKPRTITTIGNLAGLAAGTVIHSAHDRIFEYTGRNWISPGYPNDYAPIIDWLPATVLHEGVSK